MIEDVRCHRCDRATLRTVSTANGGTTTYYCTHCEMYELVVVTPTHAA